MCNPRSIAGRFRPGRAASILTSSEAVLTSSSPGPTPSGLTYRDAGVDIEAGEALVEAIKPLARSTGRAGAMGGIGGFGALFDLKAAGFRDPVLVASTDGVGTKLRLAIEAGWHDTVGIDLVAMCVNDLVVQGAEPLFFLDYFATGRLRVDQAGAVIAGIAEGCRQAGCALVGGETAEMPGMYAADDYDLAGFAVGAAERGALLPRGDLGPGDVLLGLASSGVHSNGFSLVRRVVEAGGARLADAAPFGGGGTLGEALLRPTRIYVRPLLALHRAGLLKAAAHVTGRRPAGQRAARAAGGGGGGARRRRLDGAAGVPLAGAGGRPDRGRRDAARVQLRDRHGGRGGGGGGGRGRRGARRGGRDGVPHRPARSAAGRRCLADRGAGGGLAGGGVTDAALRSGPRDPPTLTPPGPVLCWMAGHARIPPRTEGPADEHHHCQGRHRDLLQGLG